MRRQMVLVMIAEMEAAQQRGEPAEVVAPGPVPVAERLRFMPVRKVGAEQEELQ
jgi:hypothetical protein